MASNNCPFERPIQTVYFKCSHSQKIFIGEKEGIICTNPNARLDCVTLVKALKNNARFALKLTNNNTVLTHGQDMKLKCGGLKGIQEALPLPVEQNDIASIIKAAVKEFGDINKLPFPKIMRIVNDYRIRRG